MAKKTPFQASGGEWGWGLEVAVNVTVQMGGIGGVADGGGRMVVGAGKEEKFACLRKKIKKGGG